MSVLCPFCNHYWVLHGIAGCGYTSAGGRCPCQMSPRDMRRSPTEYPLPDAPDITDREARAMIVALQAQLDAVHARLDALERARDEVGPVLCECGHLHGAHNFVRADMSPCMTKIDPMQWCTCAKWRPVSQVTP